jgi:hypothetical protein
MMPQRRPDFVIVGAPKCGRYIVSSLAEMIVPLFAEILRRIHRL